MSFNFQEAQSADLEGEDLSGGGMKVKWGSYSNAAYSRKFLLVDYQEYAKI